jgi:hypothetical protein
VGTRARWGASGVRFRACRRPAGNVISGVIVSVLSIPDVDRPVALNRRSRTSQIGADRARVPPAVNTFFGESRRLGGALCGLGNLLDRAGVPLGVATGGGHPVGGEGVSNGP